MVTFIPYNHTIFCNSDGQFILNMFWQGGGKKRIQQILQTRLQPIRQHIDLPSIPIARTDQQLLYLYYHRNQLHHYDHQVSVARPHLKQESIVKDSGTGGVRIANQSNQKIVAAQEGRMNLLWMGGSTVKHQGQCSKVEEGDRQNQTLMHSKQSRQDDNQRSIFFPQPIRKTQHQTSPYENN